MTQEPIQYEEATEFNVDPAKPPEDTFEFLGRFTSNRNVYPPKDYVDKAEGARPVKWRQEFEALDVVREDGTPAIFSNSPSATRGDGVTPLGEGSAWNVLGLAWKGLVGTSMGPRDPDSAKFLGSVFRLRSKRIKAGDWSVRLYLPIEVVGGADYVYQGEKRTLQSRSDNSQAPTTPPPPPSQDDDAIAAQLVGILHGGGRAEALSLFLASHLKATPMLYGQSMHSGLSGDGALINTLIEKGLVKEENGVLKALATAPPPASGPPTEPVGPPSA